MCDVTFMNAADDSHHAVMPPSHVPAEAVSRLLPGMVDRPLAVTTYCTPGHMKVEGAPAALTFPVLVYTMPSPRVFLHTQQMNNQSVEIGVKWVSAE